MSDLGDLGLSSYEEAAYRALLSLGPATASEVADASDVPRGRIYDVLNGLAGRDVVRSHATTEPRRYEAVAPDRAVERLLDERTRELARERERYEELAASVSDELSRTLPLRGQFWEVGLGGPDAVGAMREQFDRADDRLLSVVGPPYEAAPFEAYGPEVDAYADLVAADLEVKLLTTPGILESQPAGQLFEAVESTGDFAVRTTPDVGLTFDVLDGEAVYAHLPAPFTSDERLGGVVVRDADLAAAMEARFRTAWDDATPVEPGRDGV